MQDPLQHVYEPPIITTYLAWTNRLALCWRTTTLKLLNTKCGSWKKRESCLADWCSFPQPTIFCSIISPVHPAHQGRGIGRGLLALADHEAAAQGYRELRLYTHETMTENIDMYAHLGWIETGRGEQDGYQRVFMRKPIPSA